MIGHKLRGTKKFATVLQLEPLHTCNLTCTGCGRIREYSTSLKDMMSLEDCLGAANECDAPMISICGGEPLIYPHIEALVDGLLEQRRIVYICTNAMFMRKKMREWMASQLSIQPEFVEEKIATLLGAGLLSEKDAAEIRKGPKDAAKPTIGPTKWMYWNVHLDGLERTHDLIVEREGVFKECILAIKMAKLLGYQVATNTTIYKETDMQEIEQMFDYLSDLGVDGHTITPGYEYDAAKKDMVKRLNLRPENFFLTRAMTIQKFQKIEEWMSRYTFFGTPVYFEFLARQARFDLFGLGDSDAKHSRLERALLSHDRRALRELRGASGKDRMGPIRRRERRRARQSLRELHGALRLRADCNVGAASTTRRHVENDQVQFRLETETDRPWQRSSRV